MRLSEYLRSKGLSYFEFSQLSGVQTATLAKIAKGGGATATSAIKIIRASRGKVKLEDLTPDPNRSTGNTSQKRAEG